MNLRNERLDNWAGALPNLSKALRWGGARTRFRRQVTRLVQAHGLGVPQALPVSQRRFPLSRQELAQGRSLSFCAGAQAFSGPPSTTALARTFLDDRRGWQGRGPRNQAGGAESQVHKVASPVWRKPQAQRSCRTRASAEARPESAREGEEA